MVPVIGNYLIKGFEKVYRFRSGYGFATNKQILQVGLQYQDWDTNTGQDEGPVYVSWKDATRQEAKELICQVEK